MMRQMVLLVVLGLLACQTLAKITDFDEEQDIDVKGGYDNRVQGTGSAKGVHPCAGKNCEPGYECDLDDNDKPICICTRKCPSPGQTIQVCSTKNMTFDSECEFFRQKCLCHHKKPECVSHKHRNAHLDYYGPCKAMKHCEAEEMEDFPHRMREWLFYIMEELDNRKDLGPGAHKMVQEAKQHIHRWALPVIWKFCDLDMTHDRIVNSEELIPITAPLKPLEHCTGPFLEKCDENDDGTITLEEWGLCLGLDPEEIEDRCEELRDD